MAGRELPRGWGVNPGHYPGKADWRGHGPPFRRCTDDLRPTRRTTMALRVCAHPGCPTLIPQGTRGGRCPTHQRVADQARGTREQRGYGPEHQARRAALVARMAAGHTITCWRCGQEIDQSEPWDLGHDDHDRSITRGPEHVKCNRSAAGRKRHT